jgi:hypothetical protein
VAPLNLLLKRRIAMSLNTANLLESLPRWNQKRLSREIFGECPRCPEPEDPLKDRGEYRVVHIDSYSFAVCKTHKVRWCLGYVQLGERPTVYLNNDERVPNPRWPEADRATRRNAGLLLLYEDVTLEVAKEKSFGPLRYREETISPEKLYELRNFLDTVPDADLLGDLGLEARATGLINYLDADFMCFVKRDESGRLVRDNPE